MKKLTLTLLAIVTLLFSCNSDDPDNNGGEKVLLKIERTSANEFTTINYETNEKVLNHYSNTTLMSEYTYDNQDLLTSLTTHSSLSPEDISRQYTYNYDDQGELTSFHYFRDNGGFEDIDQDRNLIWTGNSLSVPLVDNFATTINHFFTFNDNNLISSFTLNKYNQDKTKLNFEYDNNENVVRFYGFTSDLLGNQVDFDIQVTYDDKVNPYYAHYNKYYYQNLIILCEDFGFSGIPMLQVYSKLGKNNPLTFDDSFNTPNVESNHYTYDYDGNYPTKAYLKKADGTIKSTTEFIYQ